MQQKNPDKFVEIFGRGDASIAESLLILTTAGQPDVQADSSVPASGQAFWNDIRKKKEGKELTVLANGPKGSELPVSREIRGKRVQPIPVAKGAPATDIWTGEWKQRFLDAGEIVDFQEAQLDLAVEVYFDSILPLAKKNKVRSALGLAFVAACNIRGGVGSELSRLFYRVATEIGVDVPFRTSEDERKCLNAIAAANGNVGGIAVEHDESRQAKLLIKDDLGFLVEDLYDISNY
jgi:hypothetical protein